MITARQFEKKYRLQTSQKCKLAGPDIKSSRLHRLATQSLKLIQVSRILMIKSNSNPNHTQIPNPKNDDMKLI